MFEDDDTIQLPVCSLCNRPSSPMEMQGHLCFNCLADIDESLDDAFTEDDLPPQYDDGWGDGR